MAWRTRVTQSAQKPVENVDGQPDHVVEPTPDEACELGAAALDGVGARLVEGLAGGNIGPDPGWGKAINPYPTGSEVAGAAAIGADHRNGADHGMLATTEVSQHQCRRMRTLRLAQAFAIEHHHGVAPNHPLAGPAEVNFGGLAPGCREGLASGGERADGSLVERGGLDLEVDAGGLEQLTAAW